jgi:predicted esterase
MRPRMFFMRIPIVTDRRSRVHMSKFFKVLLFVGLTGCATKGATPLDYNDPSTYRFTEVDSTATQKVLDYSFADEKAEVEWFQCLPAQSRGTLIMVNRDEAAFSVDGFCKSWLAQSGLASGMKVIGINRPAFGKSTGPYSYGGPRDVEAISAVVVDAEKAGTLDPQKKVFWGYGTGAISAAQTVRQKFRNAILILGGGIYDTEKLLMSADAGLKSEELKAIVAVEGSQAHEARSLAWSFENFPPKVIIYHGEKDQKAPIEKAESMRDGLQSANSAVDFQVIAETGHEIPLPQHRALLQQLLEQLQI